MNAVLSHRVDGEGEPLVLLNGGMMSILAWEPIARPLADHYRVVRCDFRGQLTSPGEAHPELEGHVADLVALLDALEIERAHVVGASFGAEVGLLLAALHPDRLRSLIAVTATDLATAEIHDGAERTRRLVADILSGGERGPFHDALVADVYSADYVADHQPELAARRAQMAVLPEAWFAGLDGIVRCVEDLDLRPWLGRIRCPTLVVVAGDDRVMPPERSRALAEAIEDCEVVELESCGHALVAENPQWLVEQCLAFLDRQSFLDHPLSRFGDE